MACKGNVAQTVKASIAYTSDYDGWHCPLRDAELGYPSGEATRWYAGKRLGGYIGLKEPGRTNNLKGTVFMCPALYSVPFPQHPRIGRLTFFRLRCSQIDTPSRRAFMTDDNHYYFNAGSAWNEGIHIPPTATYRLDHRHNRRGNYGYFDGHVQSHDEFGAHDADMCNRFNPKGDYF